MSEATALSNVSQPLPLVLNSLVRNYLVEDVSGSVSVMNAF